MNFKSKLENYQNIINAELNKYIDKDDVPEKVLNESMEYSLMAGGKRIRPILILESYSLFKEDYEFAMPFAVAMELVHNFSLIHDDLPGIDNDDFRHGKPTNHKKFNEATAILAGDGLLNKAYCTICEELIKGEKLNLKVMALSEFAKSISNMIAGEYLDTELEGKDISKEMLMYIHKNKTGALLKSCVKIGAILADASESDICKLEKYADKIGLAFQIKDDILSEEGDSKITGKPVGNDKDLNKCTYVKYFGLDGAKKELNKLTEDAINEISAYGEKACFLKDLAIFIAERNK